MSEIIPQLTQLDVLTDHYEILQERTEGAKVLYPGNISKLAKVRAAVFEFQGSLSKFTSVISAHDYVVFFNGCEAMIGALVEARNAKPPDGPHSQKGEQQESNTYELSHAGTQEMIEDKASEMEAKVMNIGARLGVMPDITTIRGIIGEMMEVERQLRPYRLRNSLAPHGAFIIRVPRWNERLQRLEPVPEAFYFPRTQGELQMINDAYLDVLLRWYTDVTTIMATRTREARLGKLAGILGVALFA